MNRGSSTSRSPVWGHLALALDKTVTSILLLLALLALCGSGALAAEDTPVPAEQKGSDQTNPPKKQGEKTVDKKGDTSPKTGETRQKAGTAAKIPSPVPSDEDAVAPRIKRIKRINRKINRTMRDVGNTVRDMRRDLDSMRRLERRFQRGFRRRLP